MRWGSATIQGLTRFFTGIPGSSARRGILSAKIGLFFAGIVGSSANFRVLASLSCGIDCIDTFTGAPSCFALSMKAARARLLGDVGNHSPAPAMRLGSVLCFGAVERRAWASSGPVSGEVSASPSSPSSDTDGAGKKRGGCSDIPTGVPGMGSKGVEPNAARRLRGFRRAAAERRCRHFWSASVPSVWRDRRPGEA